MAETPILQGAQPAPGFRNRPEHEVVIEPFAGTVAVSLGGVRIAESRRALELRESGYPPVLYVPLEDVNRDLLVASNRDSYCPFKGRARYWSVKLGEAVVPDALWAYETPFEECRALAGHVAFYADKAEIETEAGN